MIDNGYVATLLELLGFQLVAHSGKMYVVGADDQYVKLENAVKDQYHFSYEKDGEQYTVKFNNTAFKLSSTSGESVLINGQDVSYVDKPEGSRTNNAFVALNPSFINLYYIKDYDEGSLETGYKIYRELSRMEESIVYRYDGSFYRNTTVEEVDNVPTASNKVRKYNSTGSICHDMKDTELLNVDVEDYIVDRVSSNSAMQSLIERVDTFFPGLTEHYKDINPSFGRIIDSMKNKKTY